MKKKNSFLFTLFCIILIVLATLLVFNLFRIYNKAKNINLLSEYIIKNNEITNKNGLNKENSSYIFKGETDNNYILYNNLLWRIVKINNDSSITLILDDYINMLPKNLINSFFENLTNNLNTDYLTKNKVCIDEMNDNEITCNKINNNSYISLLNAYDYLNSFYEEQTFITKDKEIMWLYNNDNHTNGDSISKSNENNFYEIRPVITLKANTTYKTGNGNKENPYKIDDESFGLGSIVKINNETYVVYDFIDDIKLMSLNTIDKLNKEKVLDYLNNELYEKLNYNNILNNLNIYTGTYNNKKDDLYKEKEIKKIGIPNILDIKINNDITNYYLPNKINNFDLIYDNPIIYGDTKTIHKTRYTISLSKDKTKNFIKEDSIYIYKEGAKWKKIK